MATSLPVLTFHALDDQGSVISCPPHVFCRGIARLHTYGYRTQSLLDAVACMRQGRPFPDRTCIVNHVDAFIAPSQFCRDLHQRLGLNVPMMHLPNFVPVVAGSPPPARLVGETPEVLYFLFVGRLEKLKGLQTLIPLFHHDRKAQLWVVGTGSYEPQLRRLAAESDNIRFLGWLSERHLHALYRQAVAVIVPSLCLEIFSLVILEAFRQQTPAIVRNRGGMPELITMSGGGLVYDTQEELVAALDHLVTDPAYRHELGARGSQAYERYWTAEAHLQQYLALIHQIATRAGRSPGRRHMPGEETG
jgi:glycosyltransferase involved in cell wall biosynthesis